MFWRVLVTLSAVIKQSGCNILRGEGLALGPRLQRALPMVARECGRACSFLLNRQEVQSTASWGSGMKHPQEPTLWTYFPQQGCILKVSTPLT